MRIRSLIRYGCVLLGGFLAGSRALSAIDNWREWHRWAVLDPSGADLYRTNFWFDFATAGLAIGLAALLYHLLRPADSAGAEPEGRSRGDRPMSVTLRGFEPADAEPVQRLVLGIQREEFGVPVTLEEQPDLRDVPGHYLQRGGGFWVACDGDTVVGTIGLLDIGHAHGALRKMFVAPAHRGAARGVGAALLRTCLDAAAAAGMTDVWLGTTESFRAAHRFYEKSGFVEVPVDDLPAHFPRMRLDTRFYRCRLEALPHRGAPSPE